MYKICVPASTANFGVGFDCIGMAVELMLEVHIELLDYKTQPMREVIWKDNQNIEVPVEKNLILKYLLKTLDELSSNNSSIDKEKISFRLNIISSPIPISRGLGSSSAAIVTGVLCAFAITQTPLDIDTIIQLATKYEGHPDNVVPTILGGLQLSLTDNNKVYTTAIPIPDNIGFLALIPPFTMDTEKSRNALPNKYNKNDCINNLSRFGFMISSFYKNDNLDMLSILFDDKLHHPYRFKMINGGQQIIEYAKSINAFGGFLSGSGSSIMLCYDLNDKQFIDDIKTYLTNNTVVYNNWRTLNLKPYQKQIRIEKID